MAHCLRYKHQYGEAKRLLEELIIVQNEEQSSILTDLAMVSAGFRGLIDVAIPEKASAAFVARVKRVSADLMTAVAAGGDPSHAEFCLGVLSLAEKDQAAAALLERAVTKMITRPDVYSYGDLLARARFYLAVALAETLDESRTAYSVQLFNESLRLGHAPVTALLRRYIEALLMVNPDEASVCAERILPDVHLGPKVIDALAATDVLRRSKPILDALFKWSSDDSRTKRARFEDLRIVLRESLLARDIDLAQSALDQMELLAQTATCAHLFIEVLNQAESYDPAWSDSEAAWSAIRVLEGIGEYQQASELLIREFHRVFTSEEYDVADEAAEIIAHIKGYGLNTIDLGALEGRLAAITPQVLQVAPVQQNTPLCITIVGGDELESSYDDAIRKWCKEWNASLEIHFRHTNWSSNHGDQLENMRNMIERSDAVVVMRRIRTNLGRNVRRISKLWVGCAGESKGSIQRALITASRIVAAKRESNMSSAPKAKGAAI